MNRIRLAFGSFILTAYRWAGITILYGVLIFILGYSVMFAFYAFNSSWVAPFIIAPSNDKILDMTTKIVGSQEQLSALIVDRDRLRDSLGDLRKTKAQLDALNSNFVTAIGAQKLDNAVDAPELSRLRNQKIDDNVETDRVVAQIKGIEATIDRDLSAGLITKADAALAKTQLRQNLNESTDGKIAEVLLRDNVRQKTPTHTATLDTLAKQAELEGNIFQLMVQIKSGEEQLASDNASIAVLNAAISTAKASPYFLATQSKQRFAFAEYGTNHVKVGAPVYGCLLNMVVCHQVGVINRVFSDEVTDVHPVFKKPVRGVLLQLELTDLNAAKDYVLFLGNKPFLI